MSRLPEVSPAVRVMLDNQESPVQVAWSRDEPVLEVSARWRVDDDWWRRPVSRLYYKLRTPTVLLEVYNDLSSGEWFLERVYD